MICQFFCFHPSWIPISIGVRSCALDEQQFLKGEPLPLLWFVVPNTLDGRNQDMPRFGDDVACVGESLSCWGILILADERVICGRFWDEYLVVGVEGVLATFDCCLSECGKRCVFKRRTASLIRLPSSIKRCNKLGKRRFLSLWGRLMWWWWWWCEERAEFDDLWWFIEDFHEPVGRLSILFVLLCNGSMLPDWRRFRLTVDEAFDCCCDADGCCCVCTCWLKWRRQPERNLRISVNLSNRRFNSGVEDSISFSVSFDIIEWVSLGTGDVRSIEYIE